MEIKFTHPTVLLLNASYLPESAGRSLPFPLLTFRIDTTGGANCTPPRRDTEVTAWPYCSDIREATTFSSYGGEYAKAANDETELRRKGILVLAR